MSKLINTRIFIVDDDPFVTAMLVQILQDLNCHNIECFSNGPDCIEKLFHNPEIIFLDYQMEGMNGIEVLKKITEHSPNTPVIFTTGVEDLGVAMESIQNGSFDFLLKKNISKKEVAKILAKVTKQNEKGIEGEIY